MNNSIKRELSQACLSFAERENQRSAAGGKANFRPQVKRKLLSLLVLLCLTVSGAWAQTYVNTVNINEYVGDVEVTANQHWLITGTGSYTTNKIIIGENATVTLSGVNIITTTDTGSGNNPNYSCIQCKDYSNATIILDAGTTNRLTCTVDWCAAIQVGYESTLTIQGSGSLNAKGGQYGAGIGSNGSTACGNIVIQGGTVDATGGKGAAGIGGGQPDTNANGNCGNITISGGTVNATGGENGAGIGAGNIGQCGDITIIGGTVDAKAGSNAAGIGGGKGQTSTNNGNCGNITINGGFVSVTDKGAVCIGSGQYSTCGAITITDGTFTLKYSNTYTHGIIGGNCGTVTIDGVKNADANSTFTHFESSINTVSKLWILTRNLYEVTANLADGAYWSTFYSESGHFQAPEGTQVFAVNLTGSTIKMTEITDRIVKKGEGVVLKQATESSDAATTIAMTLALGSSGDFSTNSLKGTTISIPNPGKAYVLNNGSAGVGFYKLAAYNESTGVGTIGANKAYLTSDGALAREFFGFDETTGIKSMHNSSTSEAAKPSAQCTMHNDVFDLQGRRVAKPTKGLYIVNGKKVIIK